MMKHKSCLLLSFIFFFSVLSIPLLAQKAHDFMHDQYDSLHDSPIQQKFRRMAPMPAGVVYIQQPGEGEAEMRRHFQTMKRLGFTNLKQIMPLPTWTEERIALVALDEGIIPWWYGEGGYSAIDDALLDRLGIPRDTPFPQVLTHPAMMIHQRGVLKKRIENIQAHNADHPEKISMSASSRAFDPQIGGRGSELNERGEKLFIDWLKGRYSTVEKLNYAWNQHHAGLFRPEAGPFRDWEDVAANWKGTTKREYNHVKDIYRFKVDHNQQRILNSAAKFHAFDTEAPYRG